MSLHWNKVPIIVHLGVKFSVNLSCAESVPELGTGLLLSLCDPKEQACCYFHKLMVPAALVSFL